MKIWLPNQVSVLRDRTVHVSLLACFSPVVIKTLNGMHFKGSEHWIIHINYSREIKFPGVLY